MWKYLIRSAVISGMISYMPFATAGTNGLPDPLQSWHNTPVSLIQVENRSASSTTHVLAVAPSDLESFLATHQHVVVQFTSPDPSCTWCVGANQAFDQASKHFANKKIEFIRVQWNPAFSHIPAVVSKIEKQLNQSDVAIPCVAIFKNQTPMKILMGRKNANQIIDFVNNSVLP